ncbi:MAG: hypothetical protein FK734_20705 [Asgard group archaeon]|nr:hypothetical protein [Asgard group archaeon]
MSQVSWYPNTPRERLNFVLKTIPIFLALLFFIFFVLDWMGAYEFLEVMVRNNAGWLLKTIFGYDSFTIGYYERIDLDPLTGGLVYFGQTFPGMRLDDYPKILLIIRSCTGMEAGALLMALIFVTPAKWQNKVVAHVTNLLMMHIGNTFRVAFHFWFTQLLYLRWHDADKAFFYAHDMLSKVFGFVGIVIFTLVIERTGVKIVSTFGAWIDSIGEGIKRLTWRIRGKSKYDEFVAKEEQKTLAFPKVALTEDGNYYPHEEITNNKWNFFANTFSIFAGVAAAVMAIGLIPAVSQGFGIMTDNIATNWFGANLSSFYQANSLWWGTRYSNLVDHDFIMNMFATGFVVFGLFVGLIIVTPTNWRRKASGIATTAAIVFPLNILRLGLQKWSTWAVANADMIKDTRPLLYLNLADITTTWLPFAFWMIIVIIVFLVLRSIKVRAFTVFWAWINQLFFTLAWFVGLRDKPGAQKKRRVREATTSD